MEYTHFFLSNSHFDYSLIDCIGFFAVSAIFQAFDGDFDYSYNNSWLQLMGTKLIHY